MTTQTMHFTDPSKLWFVGDLHGQYDLLLKGMQKAGFSHARGDQLICTGDLVDYGPKSHAILEMLNHPWFHSVLGNHEKMLLTKTLRFTEVGYNNVVQYLHDQNGMVDVQRWRDKQLTDGDMKRLFEICGEALGRWICNGGDWFFSEYASYRQQMLIVEQLKRAELPHAMECRLPNHTIGVVHADAIGACWATTLSQAARHEHITLWSREWFKKLCDDQMKGHLYHPDSVITGVDAAVFGHCITPTKKPEYFGNRVYLDVGAKIGRTPYLLRADLLLERLSKIGATQKRSQGERQ